MVILRESMSLMIDQLREMEDGRKMLGIHNEAFGISHGLTPHSEELALRADEYERYDPAEQDQLWSESSKVYPDMKASDDSSIY